MIVAAALAVVGLPAALMLAAAASFHILNRMTGAIASSGQTRGFLLYVPKSYDRAKPTPLVISMHGAAAWPAHQMNTSHWNRLADRDGFLVVYPSGTGIPKIWHADAGAGRGRDVRFISDLIDALEASYNIDATRIYADGLSNGGGMAFVLSCALPDRIAAVGMVAAAQSLPWSWCADARPLPMIAFHGTADPMVPYLGGPSRDPFNPLTFPAVRDWTANWARRNRCEQGPLESAVASDVSRIQYSQCADETSVVLYTVNGGGHQWPGGKPMPEWFVGRMSSSVDATELMWKFFRAHRLRHPEPTAIVRRP
jgi:polyhydroxybutyrate depolymerase